MLFVKIIIVRVKHTRNLFYLLYNFIWSSITRLGIIQGLRRSTNRFICLRKKGKSAKRKIYELPLFIGQLNFLSLIKNLQTEIHSTRSQRGSCNYSSVLIFRDLSRKSCVILSLKVSYLRERKWKKEIGLKRNRKRN